MKRIVLLLYLFVPMCLLAQKTRVFTLSFSENDFSFTKEGDFLKIVSTDGKAVVWGDTLDPALPYVGVNILLDYTDDLADFSYEGYENLIESNVIVDYIPIDLPCNVQQKSLYSHQIEYYKKSYPEESVQFTGTHMMDGYKFLSFVVCPFRYDAENKNLYFKKDISLHLRLKSIASKDSPRSSGKNMRDIVKDLIINGNELETLYPYSTRTNVPTDTVSYKYIIVTNEALKPTCDKLAHWKTIKGVRSKVITVEDCYNAYPNLTPQLAIKTVLTKYKNNGMEYALLAGDTDIVPAQICYLPNWTQDTTDTPADLYYACLDSVNYCFSWDANGNNVYGELNDNVDLNPEFIITRSSVSNLAEAAIFVNRIIEYESSPKLDGWANKMLGCGNVRHNYITKNNIQISDSQYQGEYVYENGVQPYWNGGSFFELFDTFSNHPDGVNYDATGDHFQIEFEKGYTFVDEYSHGWANKWGWLEDETLYKLDKASSLVNSGYSIITTIACYTNAFDKISTDFPNETEYYTTCLSESFMRNPDSGILAYFGSSREGWPNQTYLFIEKFYENLLSGNDKQFGKAAMESKNYYVDFTSTSSYNYYRWLIMTLNPLGDPEMPIYTQTPQTFNNVSVSFSNGSLNVSTGINDCTICISSAADFGDSYYKIFSNANGASLNDVSEDCYLCITKQGYIPYIARVGNSVYLQNEDIVRNLSIFSSNTYVGSNVNSSITQGLVTIHKGKVTNKSAGSITIQNDFEVKSGAELEILHP